ncbi:MAG: hypothetical protein ABH865_09020 [Candidatus Omnitrophota bacterium]
MENNEKNIILLFKKFAVAYFISCLLVTAYIVITFSIIERDPFFASNLLNISTIPGAIGILFYILAFVALILSIVYTYKSSIILYNSGKSYANPGLILLVLILGGGILSILAIIYIWIKSNDYLQEASKKIT